MESAETSATMESFRTPHSLMVSLSSFDTSITARSLLTHYFYAQKWNKGELTEDDLRTYAKEYYHLVRAVPTIVEHVRDRAAERGEDTSLIEENLAEEHEHTELWERFASSLGLTPMELKNHVPDPKVAEAVSRLKAMAASGSLEDGVTLMYSMELDLPAIAKSKKDGLCAWYGKTSADAHAYFDEHLHEEEHLKVWRAFSVEGERSAKVIAASLDLQHLVLDGVCDACGIRME